MQTEQSNGGTDDVPQNAPATATTRIPRKPPNAAQAMTLAEGGLWREPPDARIR